MNGSGLEPEARTSDSLGSTVSLWDLRCELLQVLDSARGASTVPVPTDALERIRLVMREHVRHRLVRRALVQKTKVSGTCFYAYTGSGTHMHNRSEEDER